MDVRMPDGTVIRNVPEGTTKAELQAKLARRNAVVSAVSVDEEPLLPGKASFTDKLLGSELGRMGAGAAGAIIKPLQIGAHAGEWIAKKAGLDPNAVAGISVAQAIDDQVKSLRESQQRGQYAASQSPNTLRGSVTQALSEGTPEQKAEAETRRLSDATPFDAMGLLGSAAVGAVGTKGMSMGATLPARVGRGSAIGGLFASGTVPISNGGENFWQDTAVQAAGGALLGGLIPVAGAAANKGFVWGRDIKDLFSKQGARNIADRFTSKYLVGPNRQPILDALRSAPQYVKGSKPTAAEAVAGIPEGTNIASHQRVTAETPIKGISARFGQRVSDQQAARQAAIGTFAKDEATLKAAESARSAAANQDYGSAYSQAIKADPSLLKILQNPYVDDALPDAIKLAEANGVNPKTNLTQFLHYVKLGLDKQLRRTGDAALDSTEKEAVQAAKVKLTQWLGKKNPLYETARANFASASAPINQMQVGQQLLSKLANPTGKEAPGSFLSALRNESQTIKTATGMPRQELGQVLTKQQTALAENVAKDLERKLASMNPLQRTNIPGAVDIAEHAGVRIPQMLSRPAMMTNALLRSRGADIEPRVDAIMAMRYLYPKKMAAAIEKAVPSAQQQAFNRAVQDQLRRLSIFGPAQAYGRSVAE